MIKAYVGVTGRQWFDLLRSQPVGSQSTANLLGHRGIFARMRYEDMPAVRGWTGSGGHGRREFSQLG